MALSHKGSILPIRDMLIHVPDDAIYLPFDQHLASTQLVYPNGWNDHVVTDYGLYTGTGLCATLRPGEGKFNGAVAVEEATVNRFNFPSFNTSSSSGGWNHWGSTGHQGTYGQTTDRKYIYGDQQYAHWVANGPEATSNYICYQSPSLGGIPSFRSLSIIACMEDGSEIKNDKVRPTWNASTSQGVPSGTWTSIKQIPGTHFYICRAEGFHQDGTNDLVSCVSVYPGNKVYISFAQLEDKPFVTSYTEGSRTAGKLTIPVGLGLSDFTITGVFIPHCNSNSLGYGGHLLDNRNMLVLESDNAPNLTLSSYRTQPFLDGNSYDGSNHNIHSTFTALPNVPVRFFIRRSGNTTWWRFISEDGQDVFWTLPKGDPTTKIGLTNFTFDRLTLPGSFSARWDDICIFPRLLSDEELIAIHESNRSLYCPNRIDSIVG